MRRGDTEAARRAEVPYLVQLVERISDDVPGAGDTTAYLALLDRVLEDRRVTGEEGEALYAIAQEWGVSRAQAEVVLRQYVLSLARAALQDHVVTDLLVVADPDTLSGRAKKAREYGTRIMAEAVFWREIGVNVE